MKVIVEPEFPLYTQTDLSHFSVLYLNSFYKLDKHVPTLALVLVSSNVVYYYFTTKRSSLAVSQLTSISVKLKYYFRLLSHIIYSDNYYIYYTLARLQNSFPHYRLHGALISLTYLLPTPVCKHPYLQPIQRFKTRC